MIPAWTAASTERRYLKQDNARVRHCGTGSGVSDGVLFALLSFPVPVWLCVYVCVRVRASVSLSVSLSLCLSVRLSHLLRSSPQPINQISVAVLHKGTGVLTVGFNNGVFALYDTPEFHTIHSLRCGHVCLVCLPCVCMCACLCACICVFPGQFVWLHEEIETHARTLAHMLLLGSSQYISRFADILHVCVLHVCCMCVCVLHACVCAV